LQKARSSALRLSPTTEAVSTVEQITWRRDMAAITINDLAIDQALDRKAMLSIRGAGGAPWVFGAFSPFVRAVPSLGPAVNNFYQIDNSIHVDQMINHFQTIDINNSGANSTLNAVLVSSLTSGGLLKQ
jgi:hypothetical protein